MYGIYLRVETNLFLIFRFNYLIPGTHFQLWVVLHQGKSCDKHYCTTSCCLQMIFLISEITLYFDIKLILFQTLFWNKFCFYFYTFLVNKHTLRYICRHFGIFFNDFKLFIHLIFPEYNFISLVYTSRNYFLEVRLLSRKLKHNVWYIFESRDQPIFDISF